MIVSKHINKIIVYLRGILCKQCNKNTGKPVKERIHNGNVLKETYPDMKENEIFEKQDDCNFKMMDRNDIDKG